MTAEEIKKLAKEEYGKELTDDQARELLCKAEKECAAKGELPDETLGEVSGGTAVEALKNMFKNDNVVKDFLDGLGK